MRFIFITALMLFGIYKSFAGTPWQLFFFNWVTFMRPQDLDWSFWRGKPLFLIALAVLAISSLKHRVFHFKFNFFLTTFTLFYIWMIICNFTAFLPSVAWPFFNIYLQNYLLTFILVMACINSLNDVKACLATMSLSVMIVASKVAVGNTFNGGGTIRDGVDGFIGDNNSFALTLCMIVGIGVGTLPIYKNKFIKVGVILSILLTILAILYTQSRGAFLSLGIIFGISAIFSKKRIQNTIIILTVAIIGYTILPSTMFSRLDTLQNVEEDSSAMHRFDMWNSAIEIASQKPIFGVGLGNFRYYNKYLHPELLPLVTHSIYMQIVSELGFVGLMIYLTIILGSLISLHNTCRLAKKNSLLFEEFIWVESAASWMRNSLLAFIFGSAFLDMLPFDTPWYFMIYSSLLGKYLRVSLSEKYELPSEHSDAQEDTEKPPFNYTTHTQTSNAS